MKKATKTKQTTKPVEVKPIHFVERRTLNESNATRLG